MTPRTSYELRAADLCADIPAGPDVYLLKHVLHGYGDEAALAILRLCRRVPTPAGRVLVIEFVLPDVVDRPDPALEIRLMSDLNMLAVTGGRERSAANWKALLAAAGFECRRILPVPDPISMIEGCVSPVTGCGSPVSAPPAGPRGSRC